jgi:hypothetical protein
MHKLPEWHNPQGSAVRIQIREILEAQGEDEEEIRAVVKELRTIANAEAAISSQ